MTGKGCKYISADLSHCATAAVADVDTLRGVGSWLGITAPRGRDWTLACVTQGVGEGVPVVQGRRTVGGQARVA